MKPGPKPKPVSLKAAEGNRGHRALNEGPKFDPVNPKPPAHLHKYAKDEWKRLAPLLAAKGLLTAADLGTFETLCQSYALFRQSEDQLNASLMPNGDVRLIIKYPSGALAQNPLIGISNQAKRDYLKAGALFGLSPSERGRLNLPSGPEEPKKSAMAGALEHSGLRAVK